MEHQALYDLESKFSSMKGASEAIFLIWKGKGGHVYLEERKFLRVKEN